MIQYLMQSLMRQLQSKNNKGFEQIERMMTMKQNPEPYVKQLLGNMKPEEKESLFRQAKRIWSA